MAGFSELKKELEIVCQIYNWNPSNEQLLNISNDIKSRHSGYESTNQSEIVSIITNHCPDASFIIKEGVDNSDLNTLLALAIATTKTEK